MTTRDLKKLYYLVKLVEEKEEEVIRLEASVERMTAAQDGMPHSPAPDSFEKTVIALMMARERLEKLRTEKTRIETELQKQIEIAGDPQIQLILKYRFVEMLEWKEVAKKIGGGNTKDSVKMMFYRFLKKTSKK